MNFYSFSKSVYNLRAASITRNTYMTTKKFKD